MSLTLVLDTSSPGDGLKTGGEEVFHLKHALGRLDVFAGNSAC